MEDNRQKVDELYNLESDIGETTNLALRNPKKVKELKERMISVEGADQLRSADSKR